jgi:hypothetical protein
MPRGGRGPIELFARFADTAKNAVEAAMQEKRSATLADWRGQECKDPVEVTIAVKDDQILITTDDGRSVSIEAENGDLRVHGYNEVKDEPCSLRIGPDREIAVEARDYAAGERLEP